jgi:hypothetical protein
MVTTRSAARAQAAAASAAAEAVTLAAREIVRSQADQGPDRSLLPYSGDGVVDVIMDNVEEVDSAGAGPPIVEPPDPDHHIERIVGAFCE